MESAATRLNVLVLKKLERRLQVDPEANLLDLFPRSYLTRLEAGRDTKPYAQPAHEVYETFVNNELTSNNLAGEQPYTPNRYNLDSEPAVIAFPLSPQVVNVLSASRVSGEAPTTGMDLSVALAKIIGTGEQLFPPQDAQGMVKKILKLSHDLVLKISKDDGMRIECHTLEFLAKYCPALPVPKVHGLIIVGPWTFLFMSYIPGETLSSVWPQLVHREKLALSEQLQRLFENLRGLEYPPDSPLGSVQGHFCIDARREVRVSKNLIRSVEELDDFRFSNPLFGGKVYIEFLRRISSTYQPPDICFTHGDVRTENIIVCKSDSGSWIVNGIIDWEKSGFYPADYECTKITNTMSTNETDDWFLYLPQSISPSLYPVRWLLDRLWTAHVQ